VLKLGAHFSIAGGHHKALSEAALLGCHSLQIFTKNQNQWEGKPLDEEGIALFKSERKRLEIEQVLAHDSYLINLGSPDGILWKKSINAFIDEMERAEHLGIEHLVFHPGSHVGSGEENCIDRIATGLNHAIEMYPDYDLMLLLETTAGQGTNVGWRFEHLRGIIDRVERNDMLGVCFDTCHAFAAGYELRTPEGYDETWREFDNIIGLQRLKAFHLNDSKKDLGSKVDRHEHIGQGFLGRKPFEYIVNDKRFDGLAGCLETPKEGDWDRRNLITLRRLEKMAIKRTTAKKRTAAKKKTTAKKKVTARKPAAKKKTTRKTTTRKKVTARATAKKRTTTKKKTTARKKVTAKKATTRKTTPRKKTTARKKVTAKATAKRKTTARKTTRKKATPRKKTARKTTRKK
jgi:deoxyribonuclease-4